MIRLAPHSELTTRVLLVDILGQLPGDRGAASWELQKSCIESPGVKVLALVLGVRKLGPQSVGRMLPHK